MDKYNAILNKLQHTAPIVTDPEGLTQRIMKEIEQPVIRRRSKIRIIMTGIAASVLSVWMIDEINYRPVVSPTTKTEEIVRPIMPTVRIFRPNFPARKKGRYSILN